MKKLFSFIMVALMSIMTLNAEATRIYCKMAQDWWKVDGAAVGCHSWGTGQGTTWPGVRMTPVDGEADTWYIDLNTADVQNVIFTRVNGSGDIADWGAKTKDLTIPTDGKNLFTITTSSESWGDPGCDGEWSVYGGAVEKPKHDYTITVYLPAFCDDIAAYADSARVMGGFDDWSNGIWMEKKIDEDFNDCWYAEIKDVEEDTEFKLRFGTDADWKVQVQLNGANMANEAFGETTDIVLHYDGEGYGFAACPAPAARKEFVFVAGEAAEANPALFAITWGKDGSNETVKLANKADDIYTAEILETVDSLVLVRCATDATEIIWDGEGKNVWNQTANYELCDTMYFESWVEETNLFAVTCEAPQPVEDKFYVTGNAALVGEEKAWNERAIEMIDSTHTFPLLAAGEYQLKVTNGTWNNAYGFANLSEKSSSGISGDVDDNICFIVETPNDVVVSIANGKVTVIGIFEQPEPVETFDLTIVQDTLWTKDGGKVAAWIWGEELAGEWTAWATNVNDTLTLKVNEKADSIILVRCAPEAEVPTWEPWNRIDAGEIEDCHLLIITNWNEGVWCERPEPCEGEFGILVNDRYLPAEINPEHDGGTEYMLVDVELAVNDSVQLFDHCSLAGWADGVQYMEGSYEFFIENNKFVIKEAGLYDFYFQLGSPDLLYVKLHSDPQAVENIEATSVAVKFIENGQLYIIRGEHTFDAQGKMIQ